MKANAYGYGAIALSKKAEEIGVNFLGTATIEEAIELREAGITLPILIFSETLISEIPNLINYKITPTVYTVEYLKALGKETKDLLKIHLKCDTGMSRVGFLSNELEEILNEVSKQKKIEIEGFYTHFSHADSTESKEHIKQWKEFQSIIENVKQKGFDIPIFHAANSLATESFPESHLNMVRIGLNAFKEIINLESYVGMIKLITPGTGVSYGSEFIAKKETFIATIPTGYGDGIPRELTNNGHVIIKNKKYPIVGKICMDMFMVNLGETYPKIKIGDAVTIIGSQENQKITIEDICNNTFLNPREISCQLTMRVKKRYL